MAHCLTQWLTVSLNGSLSHSMAHCPAQWLTVPLNGSLSRSMAHSPTQWLIHWSTWRGLLQVDSWEAMAKMHLSTPDWTSCTQLTEQAPTKAHTVVSYTVHEQSEEGHQE